MLRIQSLWLLIAGLLALAGFQLYYWCATARELNIQSSDNVAIYIAGVALVLISLGTIFLFRKRGLQNRLSFLGMLIALILLLLEYREAMGAKAAPAYADGTWRPGIALPLLIIIALILAVRGIRRDQKILKDLQSGRLR